MAQEHRCAVRVVIGLRELMDVGRLSRVARPSATLQANLRNLFASLHANRQHVGLDGNGRHVGRVHVVDGVCTLRSVKRSVHKLLVRVFRVHS